MDLQSMRGKFIIMMVMSSLITMLCVGGVFLRNMSVDADRQVENYRQALMADVERELKIETQTAVSVIEEVYRVQQAGSITEEQARIEAANRVRELRYDDGAGYFWIDTYEGVNVVLLGRDAEGKSRISAKDPTGMEFIRAIIENGRKEGGGFTTFMFPKPNETEPLPKLGYSVSFKPYNWVIGTGIWIDYIDEHVAAERAEADEAFWNSLIHVTIVIVVVETLLVFLAIFLGNKMVSPIIRLTERIGILSTGDFRATEVTDDSSRADEIGTMSRALDTMQTNVNTMMKQVITAAQQVAAASEQLTASADQSATAIHQVADAIVRVAGACNEQFTEVDNASSQAEELKQHMDTFRDTLEDSDRQVQKTNTAAEEGEKNVMNAVSQMKRIETSVKESAEVISELGQESDKIGQIVEAISSIAEQTNLLALNAAIEAARAGEHGRGFAVVADEVRKLAEQSQTSAGEISSLIGSIQEKAQNAVSAMQSGVEQVQTGTVAVDSAGSAFRDIADMVTEVANKSGRMETIVGNLANNTTVITEAIEKINQMSRNVSGESETVSAASEEQTATMHEIADASRSLATMAQDMQNTIGKFKI